MFLKFSEDMLNINLKAKIKLFKVKFPKLYSNQALMKFTNELKLRNKWASIYSIIKVLSLEKYNYQLIN